MPFNFDPSAGLTKSVCISAEWLPLIAGLLGEGDNTDFWRKFAEIRGDTFDSDYAYFGRSSLAQIIGALGRGDLVEDNCADNEPGAIAPVYGTLYTHSYSFLASNVPTGWTINRGTPSSAGVKSADFHAGPGWNRRVTATLALSVQCHAFQYLHTMSMNLSPVASNVFALFGFFFSGGGRTTAQIDPLPEAGTWNMQLNSTLQAANSNQVLINCQIDDYKTNQADLLGDCWLQYVDLMAYSSLGDPFP